ncbi:hypothetical protein [Haloarcula nitratireducens]|uniref:TM2 domain-containing protein n=1 Tax=Haloarcula nitratireducens TaxID=2487749 RepID=A0AAW4P6P7_9EURY|nr:hypothetical protein [Halomicroarcula nitratireducens]MBX0293625.1 hypothetical protein [Halomicroarcula nitratireducens]
MSGENENSLGIALVLSFFIAGVGQLYQGRTKEGAVVLVGGLLYGAIAFTITLLTAGVAGLVLGPIGIAYWLFNLYDVYAQFLDL